MPKIEPMVARTQSPAQGSQDCPARITPEAPAASAVRMMVPRLPGSRMSSSATQTPSGFTVSAQRWRNTPIWSGGFFWALTWPMTRSSSWISAALPQGSAWPVVSK